MISTTLPPTALPRAHFLTRALSEPCTPTLDPETLAALRRRVESRLCRVDGSGRGGTGRRSIRSFDLGPTSALAEETPFRWTPRTARRAIGIMAVNSCTHAEARTPADAVRIVMARITRGTATGAPSGSLGRWVACLGSGALAAVQAEATNWATHLWCALEWEAIRCPFTVGGPDRWWAPPRPAGVVLIGRADVRVASPPPTGTGPGEEDAPTKEPANAPAAKRSHRSARAGGGSTLTVIGGRPSPASRVELGLTALVDVLDHCPTGPPGRVLGWWPACGRALIVTVDRDLLEQTADAVIAAAQRFGGRGSAPAPVPAERLGERAA